MTGSHTCSWESGHCGRVCLGDSPRLHGCSLYSEFCDGGCATLVFSALSFCLWAQEVKGWLMLEREKSWYENVDRTLHCVFSEPCTHPEAPCWYSPGFGSSTLTGLSSKQSCWLSTRVSLLCCTSPGQFCFSLP